MANLNDTAYVVPVRGFVYQGAVNAAIPTDLAAPGTAFTLVGHVGTADGDGLPTWTSDGGDVTVLGSWSKGAVRTVTEPLTENVEFSLSQIDDDSLRLYTGGDGGDTAGQFAVFGNEIGVGVEMSLLIVIQDGGTRVGFYAPKVSVSRADDIELDPEGPVLLPVRATLLDYNETTPRYTWIASHLNAPVTP